MTPITNLYGKHVEAMMSNVDTVEFFRNSGINSDVQLLTPHFFPELRSNDNDILAIYSGYVAGPSGFHILNANIEYLIQYIKQYYKPNMKIVFDNLHEGGVDIVLDIIHRVLDILKIPYSTVYYTTGALNIIDEYNNFLDRNNIQNKINILSASAWEHAAKSYANDITTEFKLTTRERAFLCFNHMFRMHRLMLLSLLLKHNLVKNSYYSFFPGNSYGKDTSVETMFSYLNFVLNDNELLTDLRNVYNNNLNSFPLVLNINAGFNKNFIDTDDIRYFENSYFSLVTETFFFPQPRNSTYGRNIIDEKSIFFSEKTFKPIAMKHPFIIASRPYSLYYLKKLGYRTFHPFIDESYDTIEDDKKRMLTIVSEVKRLCEFTDNQWLEWLYNVKEICLYNHDVLKNKTDFTCERSICTT